MTSPAAGARGLPRVPRPAWDFQYVIRKIEDKREYGFKARLVWKKFVSPEDCVREYDTWAASLGKGAEGTGRAR